jgi:signal transduction histidine kinase
MSHELRTPIFGINAGMEIALRNPDLDDRTRRSLVASLKSAKHLNQLVDDVLDFAKLDSRALQLDAKPFRVRQALLAVIDLFGERAAEKQLMLTLDDRELAEDSLLGDERRFRQIFFNLVGNAIKFTATGGISLAATSQLTERGDVMLSVTVSDTGIGIPTEQLSRLFSPFEQGSVQTGVRYGGTGLGLSISRQLTQLMGGDITVRSEPGHGSHFRVQVTLPRAV